MVHIIQTAFGFPANSCKFIIPWCNHGENDPHHRRTAKKHITWDFWNLAFH